MVRRIFWVNEILSSSLSDPRYKYVIILIYISNVNDIEIMFLYYYNSINEYIKKLLGMPRYILKSLKDMCL